MKDSNTKKLQEAGILEMEHGLTDEQLNQLETLSDAEISSLLDIKKKLTKFNWPLAGAIRPQMF